jgi:hypothetical protein
MAIFKNVVNLPELFEGVPQKVYVYWMKQLRRMREENPWLKDDELLMFMLCRDGKIVRDKD